MNASTVSSLVNQELVWEHTSERILLHRDLKISQGTRSANTVEAAIRRDKILAIIFTKFIEKSTLKQEQNYRQK